MTKNKATIKLSEYLEFFLDNETFLKKKNNTYQIAFKGKNENGDYIDVVFCEFDESNFDAAFIIPDYLFIMKLDYLFEEELPNTYKVPQNVIKEIQIEMNSLGFGELANICLKHGLKQVYSYLNHICQIFIGKEKVIFD